MNLKIILNLLLEERNAKYIDIKRSIFFIGLGISFLCRIPFIFIGFGEADAWRVANTAFGLNSSGKYIASRLPGFPLFEFLIALTIKGQWIVSNFLSICIFFLLVGVLKKLAEGYSCPYPKVLALVYSSLPSSIIYSTETMDYFFAILLLLLSWFFVTKEKYILSAIFLGCAIGTRSTSIFFLPAIFFIQFIIIYKNNEKKDLSLYLKKASICIIISISIAIICYIPSYLTHGLSFIDSPGSRDAFSRLNIESYFISVLSNISQLFGKIGLIGIFIIAVIFIKNFKEIFRFDSNDLEIASIIIMAIFLFLIYPIKPAYLLPVVPPMLILFWKKSKFRLFFLVSLTLLIPTILGVNITDLRFQSPKPFSYYDSRKNIQMTSLIVLDYETQNNSIIVVGFYAPAIEYYLKTGYSPSWGINTSIEYLLNEDQLNQSLSNNIHIYYIEGLEEFQLEHGSIDLTLYGTAITPFS